MNELSVLIIEHNQKINKLISDYLIDNNKMKDHTFSVEYYDNLSDASEYLTKNKRDIVIVNLSLLNIDGIGNFYKIKYLAGNAGLIIFSHNQNEDLAIRMVKEGAQDYLLEEELEAKSVYKSIRYSLELKRNLVEKEALTMELKVSQERIKLLKGLIPVCLWCKQARDDDGYWQQVEIYVSTHSESMFSHAVCPNCSKVVYKEEKILKNSSKNITDFY
ncbi:MAG: response regulator [Candidatus Sericytochromatia bacterium]|nr:response regulator [Candidatus Sericytochromatia bacterium]